VDIRQKEGSASVLMKEGREGIVLQEEEGRVDFNNEEEGIIKLKGSRLEAVEKINQSSITKERVYL
jgi:hypothetical protein